MNTCASVLVVFALLAVLCTAKTGYFWHITDTHVQSDYKIGSNPNTGCWEGTGKAGKFGHYDCRPPYGVELSAMMHMPTLTPDECPNTDPLFVLWTGDSVAKRDGHYSKDAIMYNLNNITSVFSQLHTTFKGKVPIYPVIGNHDAYPQHQLPPKDYWVYDYVAGLWEPFLPKDAVDTLKVSGYYTVKVTSGLRLIVLNTVLYYVPNNMTSKTESDPGGQIAWLHKTLAAAKKAGEAVYIAGHIPIRGCGESFRGHYVKPFTDAMKGYHDIIKGSFWGHHHVDSFQLIGDSVSESHVAHLAGSISPQGDRNPSFRRYMVNISHKYAIESWRTYYMNLPEVNKDGKIKWSTLYDSKTSYGLKSVTPTHIEEFTKKLKSDNKLFETMWKHRFAGGPISSCGSTCKKNFICSVLHTHPTGYEKCTKAK